MNKVLKNHFIFYCFVPFISFPSKMLFLQAKTILASLKIISFFKSIFFYSLRHCKPFFHSMVCLLKQHCHTHFLSEFPAIKNSSFSILYPLFHFQWYVCLNSTATHIFYMTTLLTVSQGIFSGIPSTLSISKGVT